VVVQELLGLPEDTPNPHLWYAPSTMPKVAGAVASDLARLQPLHAAYFRAKLSRFDTSLEPWLGAIAAFRARYDGVPVATTEPVADYLLQAMARVFPAIRHLRPVRATTGIRPTLYDWRPNEDRLSRRHELFQHPHAPGLLTITGGKLSMYRLMAEEAADAACRRLGVQARCQTAELPLPGSEREAPPAAELAREHEVTALAAAREGGGAGAWEYSSVRIDPGGAVHVFAGTSAHGQGHETAYTQLAAEVLGVQPEAVTVEEGDTATVSQGIGTFGSRSMVMGGSAVYLALREIEAKLRRIAARPVSLDPRE